MLIGKVLIQDPEIFFNYNHTHKDGYSCDTPPHVGNIPETYATFEHDGPDQVPPPVYDVRLPMDGELNFLYGESGDPMGTGGIMLNFYVGKNILNEPVYFALLHLSSWNPDFKLQVANHLQIDPSELDFYLYDRQLNFDHIYIDNPLRVPAGTHLAIENYWGWQEFSGPHHAQGVHVNLTKEFYANHTSEPEFAIPFSRFYMNWIINELVINRDKTIGLEYGGDYWCTNPELALELIEPSIRDQLTIEQNPERLHQFFLSKKPLMESASLSYEVDDQTIQRTVVVRDGGTYLDATGDDGDIPFGITATLTISGIRYAVADVVIQNPQDIDAQLVDGCDPAEARCDISISLNPTSQPESPIDASVPYSFTVALETPDGNADIGVHGEIFNAFVIEEDWLYPHIDFDEMAQILQDPEIKANYKITTSTFSGRF